MSSANPARVCITPHGHRSNARLWAPKSKPLGRVRGAHRAYQHSLKDCETSRPKTGAVTRFSPRVANPPSRGGSLHQERGWAGVHSRQNASPRWARMKPPRRRGELRPAQRLPTPSRTSGEVWPRSPWSMTAWSRGSRVLQGTSDGWPAVLSSLKTLLETGSPSTKNDT